MIGDKEDKLTNRLQWTQILLLGVSTKKFRDAYKYDIVRDYVDSQEEQLFRQTARDVRKEDKTQDQDQDGQR